MLGSLLLSLSLAVPCLTTSAHSTDLSVTSGSSFAIASRQVDVPEALLKRLKTHAYFRNVAWQAIAADGDVVYIVQSPLKPMDGYEDGLVEKLQGTVLPLLQYFEETYTRPFELERGPHHSVIPIVILPTWGTFADYEKTRSTESCYGSSFTYDRDLCAPILYVQKGLDRLKQDALRKQIGAPLTFALLQAYRGERTSTYRWYFQGLGAQLAGMHRTPEGVLVSSPLSESFFAELRRLFQGTRTPLAWHDLHDLTRIEGWGFLWTMVSNRAREQKRAVPSTASVFETYGRECFALSTFLNQEGTRAGYVQFLAGAMEGRVGGAALLEATGFESMVELDAAFRIWLSGRLGLELPPQAGTDASARLGPEGTEGTVGIAEATVSDPPPGPATGSVPNPFPGLAVLGDDPELDRCLALALVNQGQIEEALGILKRTESDKNQRMRSWLTSWVELRDAFLAQAQETGQELRLVLNGEKERLRVLSYDGPTLQVKNAKGQQLSLPLDEIDGVPLALAIKNKEAEALTNGSAWIRGVPLAFAGHDRTRRTLRSAGDEAARLLEASSGFMATERRRGPSALALEQLSGLSNDISAAQAQAALDQLKSAAPSLVSDAVLSSKLDAARDAARFLLDTIQEGIGAKAVVSGDLELLGENESGERRIRVTWNLAHPEDGSDLLPARKLDWRLTGLRRNMIPEEDWNVTRGDRSLRIAGFFACSLPVGLKPPFRIEISYASHESASAQGTMCSVLLGFATEDGQNYVLGDNGSMLECAIDRAVTSTTGDEMPTTFFETEYTLRLTFDELTTALNFGDLPIAELRSEPAFGDITSCFLPLLIFRTQAEMLLTRVVVEGTEVPQQPALAVEPWIERRLIELFED